MAKKAQIWSGTAWVDVLSNASQAIYYTSTAPSSANNGDLWIDSDDDMAANQSILDSVTSSSTSSAAASNSVKLAYDAATSTRNILINGAFDVPFFIFICFCFFVIKEPLSDKHNLL